MRKINYAAIVLLIFLGSCKTLNQVNLFSVQDDTKLGQQLADEIASNPKEYPIYKKDQTVVNSVKSIFNEVLKSDDIKYKKEFNYQIDVIDVDTVLNAFAAPGGYIYVYTGLLKYLDSEAALAGVLGHEIAHAEKRHATRRITKAYGAQILLEIVLGQNASQIANITANLFTGLAFLANSRSDEAESDRYAITYLSDTKYYPGGVKFFFEKLKADGLVSEDKSGVSTFLSTHPDPIDRISSVNQLLKERNIPVKDFKATGEGIFKDTYARNIRNRIK